MHQTFRLAAILSLATLGAVPSVYADTILKADNTVSLDLPGSWFGEMLPTSADVIGWDSTVTAPNAAATLNGTLVVAGLQLTNPGADVALTGGSLSLTGTAPTDIDLSTATRNFTLNSTLLVAGDQVWNTAKVLTLNGPVLSSNAQTVALTKAGSGTLVLNAANSAFGSVTLNSGFLHFNHNGALASADIVIPAAAPAATQIVLGDGVTLSNNLSVQSANLQSIDVPTGRAATFAGNFSNSTSSSYVMGTSGGTLTITGNHTSSSFGTIVGNVIYDGNASLESHNNVLLTNSGTLTLQGNASLHVLASTTGEGFTIAPPRIGGFPPPNPYYSEARLILRDHASLDLGALSLNVSRRASVGMIVGPTTVQLDGGSLTVGSVTQGLNGANQPTTINFNGGTLIAGAAGLILPGFGASLNARLQAGGARIDTNGRAITVGASLLHDPALGSTPDGGIIKLGDGTLTFEGYQVQSAQFTTPVNAHVSSTGPLIIQQGTVIISGLADQHDVGNISGNGALILLYRNPNDFPSDPSAAPVRLTSNGVVIPSWTIAGTHIIRPGIGDAGTSKTTSLALVPKQGTYLRGGLLDLNDNALIVQSSNKPSDLATLKTRIAAGFTSGSTDPAITSTTVAANATSSAPTLALALADNADLHYTQFRGQGVDDNSLLITQATTGDATLDGKVDALDLNLLASHWQQQQNALWSAGDFNNDNKVDALDLNLLASNWQSSLPLIPSYYPLTFELLTSSPSPIPEPASLALLTLSAAALLSRRKSTKIPLPSMEMHGNAGPRACATSSLWRRLGGDGPDAMLLALNFRREITRSPGERRRNNLWKAPMRSRVAANETNRRQGPIRDA